MKLPRTIRLTVAHIDAGLAKEYPTDPENCPIAIALGEAIPESLELEVTESSLPVNKARSIIYIRLDSGSEFIGRTDRHTADWLSRWDQQVRLLLAHKRHSFKRLRNLPPIVQ